jgi:hypothetical protein
MQISGIAVRECSVEPFQVAPRPERNVLDDLGFVAPAGSCRRAAVTQARTRQVLADSRVGESGDVFVRADRGYKRPPSDRPEAHVGDGPHRRYARNVEQQRDLAERATGTKVSASISICTGPSSTT